MLAPCRNGVFALQESVVYEAGIKGPEQLVLRTVNVAPPSQEQLMVVIEGKQKEAAVTEEVVSKDLQTMNGTHLEFPGCSVAGDVRFGPVSRISGPLARGWLGQLQGLNS